MNKFKLIIGIIAVVLLGGLLTFYKPAPAPEQELGTPTSSLEETPGQPIVQKPTTSKPAPATAKTSPVVFAIKDAAVALGNLQSLFMTISEVSIQVPGRGWVPVVNQQMTFDLLQLKREGGAPQFLAEINLAKGTYNQIRLVVDSVVVTQNNIPKIAKLPSGEMKIITNLIVEENRSSGVVLDFEADKSLHSTGNGEYIFAPVIKLTTLRGPEIQRFGKKVEFIGGVGDFSGNVGMDENGETHPNSSIDPNAKLELVRGKIVVIPLGIDQEKLKVSAEQAVDAVFSAKYIDRLLSVKAELKNNKTTWRILGMLGSALLKIYVNAETGEIIALE